MTSLIIPNPHNLFLELGLSFGVFGVLLFLWFLLQTVISAKNNPDLSQRRIIVVFVVLTPIYGIVQSTLIGYTYFWLALATMAAFARPIVLQRSSPTIKNRII